MTLTQAGIVLGLFMGAITTVGIIMSIGRFAEKTTTGVTNELKHLNTSVDGVSSELRDFKEAVLRTLSDHGERISKLEGRLG